MGKQFILFFSFFCMLTSFALLAQPFSEENGTSFNNVNQQIEQRWLEFQKDRQFKTFEAGKSDALLKEEFDEIVKIRETVCSGPCFDPALGLILDDLVRMAGCAAFKFNNTTCYFNASTMYLNGKNYISCEGPRLKDVPNFFKLLEDLNTTYLVRLTNSYEGMVNKCYPYWEGLVSESLNGADYLNIPTGDGYYKLRTFTLDSWNDSKGIDPEELLRFILGIKAATKEHDGLMVVHCSGGVGRTGTFFGALAIIDAIDKKTPFSIEEIVYRLSLQRIHSVAKFDQYLTLYRLAEIYLDRQI
jgi:hypothetical protein